ncbi:hypothetical protein Dip510_001687 [Elusimicrobium posterum]|uniref:hypothetical protein n=1 Tax=Elusimicrobium posterum TaxID=3116653 RepID=UPI003C786C66
MDILNKKLNISELMSETFIAFTKNFKAILGINFIYYLLIALAYIPIALYYHIKLYSAMFNTYNIFYVFKDILTNPLSLILFLVFIFIYTFTWCLKAGTTVKYVHDKTINKETTLKEAFKQSLKRSPHLFLTLFVISLILAVIPFIIFFIAFNMGSSKFLFWGMTAAWVITALICVFISMLVQVVVIKEKSFLGSIKYAKELVSKNYLQTLGFLLMAAIAFIGFMIGTNIINYICMFVFVKIFNFFPYLDAIYIAIAVISGLVCIFFYMIPFAFSDIPLTILYINREANKPKEEEKKEEKKEESK